MKITLTSKHDYLKGQLILTTDVESDPDETCRLTVEANPTEETKSVFEQSSGKLMVENFYEDFLPRGGHYGHSINLENLTNLDLQAAAYQLEGFTIESIEPNIVPNDMNLQESEVT